MVATQGKGWKLAPSLIALEAEVDARWPKRKKSFDGSIGDAAHSVRTSEHNPDHDADPMPVGMVSAVDITKDSAAMAEAVRKALVGDERVWYVIHAGHIWSRTHDWEKRAYDGADAHLHHVHVSLRQTVAAAEDVGSWHIAKAAPAPKPDPAPAPEPEPKPVAEHAPGSRVLGEGDKGEDVKALQRFLGSTPDGVFGPLTKKAVKRYQSMRGIPPTGEVAGATWRPILHALKLT